MSFRRASTSSVVVPMVDVSIPLFASSREDFSSLISISLLITCICSFFIMRSRLSASRVVASPGSLRFLREAEGEILAQRDLTMSSCFLRASFNASTSLSLSSAAS